jgi:protein disulfide-isomerase-like protein
MARGNRLSAPKSGNANGSNGGQSGYQSYLWIIFCLILLAIILFAIFYPRRQYSMSVQNGNMMQPYPMMNIESFEDSDKKYEDALMEPMGNNDDPEKIMSSDKPALVFFYAPWCGHCKNAKPEFEKVMQMAKGRAHMIDCDAHQEIAQKYNVKGFPTIRYYPNGPINGKPREYEGNRTAEDMMNFIR